MDMDGGDRRQRLPLTQTRQQVQEDGGVETAGEGERPARRLQPGLENVQQTGFERHRGNPGEMQPRAPPPGMREGPSKRERTTEPLPIPLPQAGEGAEHQATP
ncbi:hypothetical protein D3C78_1784950 [compost metagenome]